MCLSIANLYFQAHSPFLQSLIPTDKWAIIKKLGDSLIEIVCIVWEPNKLSIGPQETGKLEH